MKYDPVSLFEITILEDENGETMIDLAVSLGVKQAVCDLMNKYLGETTSKEELLGRIQAAIIEHVYGSKRVN